jgi:indoleamine 2,3-dioxygenase
LELIEYQVNTETGFLPAQDPLDKLPCEYAAWEQAGANLSSLLMTGHLRDTLQGLPVVDAGGLQDGRALNRAMLLLSILGNAYVWGGDGAAPCIPRAIAVPLCQVAERLGIPPIAAHTHIVLHNWRRIDNEKPVTLDNIAPLQLFLGGLDEAWFYMVTVAIEAEGGRAVDALLSAKSAAATEDGDGMLAALRQLEGALAAMLATLKRMPEKCEPFIFYHRIRPFIASWPEPGIIYEGVDEAPQRFSGGSAAQSPLIQAIDAGLDIRHEDAKTQGFLTEMRRYMLPAHCAFIDSLASGASIRGFAQGETRLTGQYNACVELLDAFRQKHLEIAVQYIAKPAREAGESAIGTGGTEFVPLLSQTRKETKARVIGGS